MRETENEINLLLSSAEVMDAPSRFLIPAVAGLAPLTIESGDDDDANP
jgi:hypothetical protein